MSTHEISAGLSVMKSLLKKCTGNSLVKGFNVKTQIHSRKLNMRKKIQMQNERIEVITRIEPYIINKEIANEDNDISKLNTKHRTFKTYIHKKGNY